MIFCIKRVIIVSISNIDLKAVRRRADGEERDCMYRLTINGAVHEIAEDGSLLDYLRDTADITSVKNGCAEGVCGACTVLIDGRTARACIQKISRLDGKSVTNYEIGRASCRERV